MPSFEEAKSGYNLKTLLVKLGVKKNSLEEIESVAVEKLEMSSKLVFACTREWFVLRLV